MGPSVKCPNESAVLMTKFLFILFIYFIYLFNPTALIGCFLGITHKETGLIDRLKAD